MIDTFNLTNKDLNRQIFYVNSSGETSWKVWQKPNNINFVHIFVLGSGAGGGGGGTGGGTAAEGGGGGGGSSAYSIGLFPACLLPDNLYVQVGRGGAGGSPATTTRGSSGELSYVSISAATSVAAIIMKSGAAVPTGGAGTNSTAAGALGAAGTIWDFTLSIFSQLGQVTANAGQAGVAGGTSAQVGNSITLANLVSGGAGGGGANLANNSFAGGSISGTGFINSVTGGQPAGNNGSGGHMTNIPSISSSVRQAMLFTGGAGGAGNFTAGGGGFGGNGAYGCGGGGGGGSVNGTGGFGGRGGDGIVIITSY